jgi:hypothetical protein
MSKSLNTVRTGMSAYMGIAAKIELERIAKARADEAQLMAWLNDFIPPVAATLVWNGKDANVYQTHYMGDVKITRKARRHLVITC